MKRCRYCHIKSNLTRDHIIPKSRGGSNERKNIQILCDYCNHRKNNLTDEELANIFRDLEKRGVWYDWEEKYMVMLKRIRRLRKSALNW
jgi:hypothetical protein